MPSAAWDAAQSGLRSANEQARMGNRAEAVKALTYAKSQINAMSVAEKNAIQPDLLRATSEVYKARTPAEIAAGKAAFESRVAAQRAAVGAENARTGGVDPGGEWYSPSAWGFGRGSAPSSLTTKLVWIGGGLVGLYFFSKILNYMTAGRQVQAARYSTAQAALSMNPKRRRRRRRR